MALLLNQSTLNAYLRHAFASAPGYPITIALKVLNQGTGSTGDYLNLTAPGGSQTANLIRSYFAANGTSFGWGSRTSWGSSTEEIAGGASQYGVADLVTNTGAAFKNVFIVAPSNTSAWTLYSEDYPTGRTLTPNNGASGEFAQCTDLLIGAFLNLGAISNHARVAVAELAVWTDARTNANYTSYAANTAAETINPASLYEVWSLDVAGAAGSSVTGTLTGLVNGRALTVNGTVVKAYQAHPVSRSTPPSFSANPANQTVTQPATATFSATYTGTITGHQWQVSTDGGGTWGNVPDGTGASGGAGTGATLNYTTTATAVSTGNHRNGYRYRCQLTHSGGTVNSASATLTVNAAAPLSVTLDAIVDESGNPRASYTVDKILAVRVSDNAVVAVKTAQTTNGSGVLPAFSDAALTAVPHLFVTYTATGLRAGAKVYTPA